jgi:hypothetical protein
MVGSIWQDPITDRRRVCDAVWAVYEANVIEMTKTYEEVVVKLLETFRDAADNTNAAYKDVPPRFKPLNVTDLEDLVFITAEDLVAIRALGGAFATDEGITDYIAHVVMFLCHGIFILPGFDLKAYGYPIDAGLYNELMANIANAVTPYCWPIEVARLCVTRGATPVTVKGLWEKFRELCKAAESKDDLKPIIGKGYDAAHYPVKSFMNPKLAEGVTSGHVPTVIEGLVVLGPKYFRLRAFKDVKVLIGGSPWFWPPGHFMYNTKAAENAESTLTAVRVADQCTQKSINSVLLDLDDTVFMSSKWTILSDLIEGGGDIATQYKCDILQDPRVAAIGSKYEFYTIFDKTSEAEKKWDEMFGEICGGDVPVSICTKNGLARLLLNEGIAVIRDEIDQIHIIGERDDKIEEMKKRIAAGTKVLLIDNDERNNPDEGDPVMKSVINDFVEIRDGHWFFHYKAIDEGSDVLAAVGNKALFIGDDDDDDLMSADFGRSLISF